MNNSNVDDNSPAQGNEQAPQNSAPQNINPLQQALDNSANDPQDIDYTQNEQTASSFGFAEGEFSREGEELMARLCDTHGLEKAQMAPFLKELVSGSRELEDAAFKAEEEKKVSALKTRWGKEYDNRVKRVAGFIRQVGRGVGWSEEQVNTFANADGFRLFDDLMRFVGEGRTIGKNAPPAPADPMAGLSREQLQRERARTAREYWNASSDEERERLSLQNARIRSMLSGKEEEPILPFRGQFKKK